tara:strand:+ start:378 stop:866 length:489 start_codon:yes stop_codon:yes gene_type:complete
MDSQIVIFYSERCNHSKKALELIKENNIKIQLQSIDRLQKMPDFLKVVPTIIIKKDSKKLEGKEVFKFLEQQKDNSNIQPFFSNEMTGYSDGYSYLDTNSQIDHSYEYLNKDSNTNQENSTNPFDNPKSSNGSSQKEDEFNKDLEKYMQNRNQGIPEPFKRT